MIELNLPLLGCKNIKTWWYLYQFDDKKVLGSGGQIVLFGATNAKNGKGENLE